jgi:hypothetical protein
VSPKIPELGNKTRIFHDPPGEILIVVGAKMAIFPRLGMALPLRFSQIGFPKNTGGTER